MKLFVYGSLRRDAKGVMADLLREKGVYIDEGKIAGIMYSIGWYPGVIRVGNGDPKFNIIGDIYEIDEDVLDSMDRYEGYPVLFDRQLTEAYMNTPNGFTGSRKVECWVYYYNQSYDGCPIIEHGDYLKHISEDDDADAAVASS